MSNAQVLQRLLTSGEYDELEDIVIVEGQFVEVDEDGIALRQLILGLTPELLLTAEYKIVSYKENPAVYFDTDADPLLDGLEISSMFPVGLMELVASRRTYALKVTAYGRNRYFEMANTRMNGDLEYLWYQWLDRVDYLHRDPYGYIRALLDRYSLPYPSYLCEIEDESKENSILQVKSGEEPRTDAGEFSDAVNEVIQTQKSSENGQKSQPLEVDTVEIDSDVVKDTSVDKTTKDKRKGSFKKPRFWFFRKKKKQSKAYTSEAKGKNYQKKRR